MARTCACGSQVGASRSKSGAAFGARGPEERIRLSSMKDGGLVGILINDMIVVAFLCLITKAVTPCEDVRKV